MLRMFYRPQPLRACGLLGLPLRRQRNHPILCDPSPRSAQAEPPQQPSLLRKL